MTGKLKLINDRAGALRGWLAYRDGQYVGRIERGITTGLWDLYNSQGWRVASGLDYRFARSELKLLKRPQDDCLTPPPPPLARRFGFRA